MVAWPRFPIQPVFQRPAVLLALGAMSYCLKGLLDTCWVLFLLSCGCTLSLLFSLHGAQTLSVMGPYSPSSCAPCWDGLLVLQLFSAFLPQIVHTIEEKLSWGSPAGWVYLLDDSEASQVCGGSPATHRRWAPPFFNRVLQEALLFGDSNTRMRGAGLHVCTVISELFL